MVEKNYQILKKTDFLTLQKLVMTFSNLRKNQWIATFTKTFNHIFLNIYKSNILSKLFASLLIAYIIFWCKLILKFCQKNE